MSTLEQAEAWVEAQAIERIAALEADNAELREALAGAMAEVNRLDPHIQDPRGTGFDTALLAQPFDLAAHQKRMAREYVTEERLFDAIRTAKPVLVRMVNGDPDTYALMTAILAALFEEET